MFSGFIQNIRHAGTDCGAPILIREDGGKAENHALELGSGQFIPGFEEQLVGAKVDDELDVNVTFPEDYHAKELAGKAAVFKCKIHKLEKKELHLVAVRLPLA